MPYMAEYSRLDQDRRPFKWEQGLIVPLVACLPLAPQLKPSGNNDGYAAQHEDLSHRGPRGPCERFEKRMVEGKQAKDALPCEAPIIAMRSNLT